MKIWLFFHRQKNKGVPETTISYSGYKDIFKGRKLPLAFINMDLLDENIRGILRRSGNIPVRIASKSIRCRYILDYIFRTDKRFQGIMSYSGSEAVFLSRHGFNDILVAYPVVNPMEIDDICMEIKKGKYINLMVDRPGHLQLIEKSAESHGVKVPVCLDIDVSVDFPGLHFGVWRSAIRTLHDLKTVLNEIKKLDYVSLEGLMGYEAQIAGVVDNAPGQWLMNHIIRLLKSLSVNKIVEKRKRAVDMILDMGFELKIINGGGTGSLETTTKETAITEVPVGSGFYNSHLFDNYQNFMHRPAAGFALAVNRMPAKDIYTCAGGGYIASGAPEKLKLPLPYLPQGTKLDKNEGAGEVQTPVYYKGPEKIGIGDPVFFRHSKAGELCERFNSLLLIRDNEIVNEVPTYRGEGQCFL